MIKGLGQGAPTEVAGGARNLQQDSRSTSASQGRQPSDEQDRVRYGVITETNDNNLVKVSLLNADGDSDGKNIVQGAFLPLMNPLAQIHMIWGSLREGLICRVWWRGKLEPNASTVIEIIADEEHNFLKKETESNEVNTQPYALFTGGIG